MAFLAFALLGSALSGCTTIEGGPPRLFTVAEEADVARARLTAAEDAYYRATASKWSRNEIVAARMREIDSYYFAFEASLIRERQESGFVSSIVSLALTGAIPLVGSLGTKSALGAASTFVQGGTKAFSDEVLFQKTVQVLATQMRSHRALVASQIVDRMRKLDIDAYPLSMALGDLDEYYAAGTIAGALIEIQKTVSAQSAEAETTKAVLMVQGGTFDSTDATMKLVKKYLAPGPKHAARVALLKKCLVPRGFLAAPSTYAFSPSSGRARAIMMDCAQQAGDPM
ncbi:hypothetical protein [uncultured Bradyrhizobium sp.]|jgi:hypothetical protein|uniref:hypothetical protein n=1 Tax=uncultured Bradyrhizobium sp. TaxID=199684 RepID=UPI00261EB22F|nr:hypothetical protein [uncultured Bradyrhizobium sp.]